MLQPRDEEMEIQDLSLRGLKLIAPAVFRDVRGSFSETWNRRRLAEHGLDLDFVQDNHSVSVAAGTIRGLHYQSPPHAQDKLVRCVRGRIWDVAVDIRKGSPTYGKWDGAELSAANGRQLFVPKGFLHGFVTLEPDTEVLYKCTDYYSPECDGAVHWSTCGIEWPFDGTPVLSAKDAEAQSFQEFESPFVQETIQ
jgi:dTDP-4-dehydrorhamnose 3,5-epimerase